MQLGAFWALVQSTDWVTTIILLGLIITYLACCALSVYKFCMFRREIILARTLEQQISHVRRHEDVLLLMRHYGIGAYHVCDLVQEGIQQWQLLMSGEQWGGLAVVFDQTVERYQQLQDQVVEQHLEQLKSGLSALSISAAASPLIGLFGTIWGLIHAFINIGAAKSADLAVIAPGVAEALLTTLAGLIVAIPALIFYHYLTGQARNLEQLVWRVSDRLTMILAVQVGTAHTVAIPDGRTPISQL